MFSLETSVAVQSEVVSKLVPWLQRAVGRGEIRGHRAVREAVARIMKVIKSVQDGSGVCISDAMMHQYEMVKFATAACALSAYCPFA